jgi:hypothetical protein
VSSDARSAHAEHPPRVGGVAPWSDDDDQRHADELQRRTPTPPTKLAERRFGASKPAAEGSTSPRALTLAQRWQRGASAHRRWLKAGRRAHSRRASQLARRRIKRASARRRRPKGRQASSKNPAATPRGVEALLGAPRHLDAELCSRIQRGLAFRRALTRTRGADSTLNASQGHERKQIRVTTMTSLDHRTPRRAAKPMAGVLNQYGTRWPSR